MTTLTILKARISSDLDDADDELTDDIADAITRAIEYYQPMRFDFNETRDETFSTVADQQIYTSSDDAAIPLFYKMDLVTITVAGQRRPLEPVDHRLIEVLSDNSASTGEPYSYAYFDRSLQLYPIPDDVYTVRMIGHIKKAAPATDEEANNVWMVDGYQLIREKAKEYIAKDVLDDAELEAKSRRSAKDEENRLTGQTNDRIGSGCIEATTF